MQQPQHKHRTLSELCISRTYSTCRIVLQFTSRWTYRNTDMLLSSQTCIQLLTFKCFLMTNKFPISPLWLCTMFVTIWCSWGAICQRYSTIYIQSCSFGILLDQLFLWKVLFLAMTTSKTQNNFNTNNFFFLSKHSALDCWGLNYCMGVLIQAFLFYTIESYIA